MDTLTWVKSRADTWLSFTDFNLASCACDSGVYIIWHAGNPSRVVYVGQGCVPDRIAAHRRRDDICAYGKLGELYVTWAAVPPHLLDGVERYLADKWGPLVGDAHPDVAPVAVNSPW